MIDGHIDEVPKPDREKLLDLICGSPAIKCENPTGDCKACHALADHLIANGVTIQRWIPVEERLPVPGERVLATDGGFVGEFYINDRGKWRRYNVNHHELLMALDILWWMPIPEPPIEEQNRDSREVENDGTAQV